MEPSFLKDWDAGSSEPSFERSESGLMQQTPSSPLAYVELSPESEDGRKGGENGVWGPGGEVGTVPKHPGPGEFP